MVELYGIQQMITALGSESYRIKVVFVYRFSRQG